MQFRPFVSRFLMSLSVMVTLASCDQPPDAESSIEPETAELATAGSNFGVSVTGRVEVKAKFLTTKTLATPAIRQGKVLIGPKPASCTTRGDGVQVCHYTMIWQGITVDTFTVNGKTVRNLQVDTVTPIYIAVAQGKFTVPANTARFILTGTTNNTPFYMNRALDSAITGTFNPNGTFSIATVVTRTVSGPIGTNIRVWGNISFSGGVGTATPFCKSTGPGRAACEPGGIPSGTCSATKLHRTVIQCNGSSKAAEQVIDLVATGYGNYTCSNRFPDHCIGDGSFDSYYSEWCEFSCR